MTTYGEDPADRPEGEPDRTRREPGAQPEPTPGYPGAPGGPPPGYPPQSPPPGGPPPGYPPPSSPGGPPPGYPPQGPPPGYPPPGYPPAQQPGHPGGPPPGYPPQGYPQQPGGTPPPGYGQPPSGYPGQYPPAGGYGAPPPPGYAGYGTPPPGWQPAGPGSVYDTGDPLVPGTRAGLNGWYERILGVVKRSWREVLVILAITVLAPAVVLTVLGGGAEARNASNLNANLVGGLTVGVTLALLVVAIASVFLFAAGAAASTYTIARQAAGAHVDVGEALRYGFRRAGGMWGWLVLSGLIVAGGLILCILPGLYFIVALSLVIPAVVFERGNPISRSFKLVNANFGPALGRVALLALTVFVYQGVLSCVSLSIQGAVVNASAGVRWGTNVIVELVVGALGLPLDLLVLTGVLVLYAELRNRELPVNTSQLVADAG